MLVKLCVDADRDRLKKHQPRAASHSLDCFVKDCMRCFMQIIEVIVSAHPQSRLVVRTGAVPIDQMRLDAFVNQQRYVKVQKRCCTFHLVDFAL